MSRSAIARALGAALVTLSVLGIAPALFAAPRIEPSPAEQGAAVTIYWDEGSGAVTGVRMPNSRVSEDLEAVGATEASVTSWTPEEAGLYQLRRGEQTATVVVGFAQTPLSGVAVLLFAAGFLIALSSLGLAAPPAKRVDL
jgi:hypothetical protein